MPCARVSCHSPTLPGLEILGHDDVRLHDSLLWGPMQRNGQGCLTFLGSGPVSQCSDNQQVEAASYGTQVQNSRPHQAKPCVRPCSKIISIYLCSQSMKTV